MFYTESSFKRFELLLCLGYFMGDMRCAFKVFNCIFYLLIFKNSDTRLLTRIFFQYFTLIAHDSEVLCSFGLYVE